MVSYTVEIWINIIMEFLSRSISWVCYEVIAKVKFVQYSFKHV